MSQALYRRYRPETFADVIGQEHVTEPLMQALRNDRVNHAYLFSGPRGCGKTTSARILARCLNCAQGPTPEPCGVCDSCVALARGGPGHIDVIEIDAASHGGVDDARELRDKAFFSPAASRYKIYIVDEAHMVSSQGFNALLKLVEEPPSHLKFIFATTEPDKVIGTIRSRTHHYPFRLVPPSRLQDYLAGLCVREGVAVAKGVLPLVVRAGAGSVRDSLSVLDQLMAGADEGGVTYPLAIALLGYTDSALLDEVVEAFAAADGAAVFAVVERVIEGGLDPRRFAEDLLTRMRDLIVLEAAPAAAASLLGDLPDDQVDRLRQQAGRFGAAELSRAADLLSLGLTEMRGATAPRLQLELMCARVLLPGASDDPRSIQARLDRIERRFTAGGMAAPSAGSARDVARAVAARSAVEAATAAEGTDAVDAAADVRPPGAVDPAGAPAVPGPATGEPGEPGDPVPGQGPTAGRPDQVGVAWPDVAVAGEGVTTQADPDTAAPTATEPVAPAPAAPDGIGVAGVRSLWGEVTERLAVLKRTTWTLVSQNAKVLDLGPGRLTLGFASAGLRDAFTRGAHANYVHLALIDVLGLDVEVEAIIDPSAGSGVAPAGAGADRDAAATPAPAAARPAATRPAAARPAATRSAAGPVDGTGPAGSAPAEPVRDAPAEPD